MYEVDPLVCLRCNGAIRVIAFIEQSEVIEKIMTHLGLCPFAQLRCTPPCAFHPYVRKIAHLLPPNGPRCLRPALPSVIDDPQSTVTLRQ